MALGIYKNESYEGPRQRIVLDTGSHSIPVYFNINDIEYGNIAVQIPLETEEQLNSPYKLYIETLNDQRYIITLAENDRTLATVTLEQKIFDQIFVFLQKERLPLPITTES